MIHETSTQRYQRLLSESRAAQKNKSKKPEPMWMPVPTELDPVFQAHPASDITSQDIRYVRAIPDVIENIRHIELTPGPKGDKGEPGARGIDGQTPIAGVDFPMPKDGKEGKPGKAAKDASVSFGELKGIANSTLTAHETAFNHSLLHDPSVLGTTKVDESGMENGKVLMYDRKKGRLVYEEIKQQTTVVQQGGGGGIPQQAGNTGKFLKTVNGRLVWASAGSGSGVTRSVLSVAVNTTAAAVAETDYVYLCSSTITITLPTAVGNVNLYTIKNVGNGTITIAFNGAQTGDGSTTMSLPVRYTSVDLISDGTNWNVT